MFYTEAEIEEMVAEDVKAFECEGYYEIAFSDGGMKWTNEGPLYFETAEELADELRAAYGDATETHLPYAEKVDNFQGAGWYSFNDDDEDEREAIWVDSAITFGELFEELEEGGTVDYFGCEAFPNQPVAVEERELDEEKSAVWDCFRKLAEYFKKDDFVALSKEIDNAMYAIGYALTRRAIEAAGYDDPTPDGLRKALAVNGGDYHIKQTIDGIEYDTDAAEKLASLDLYYDSDFTGDFEESCLYEYCRAENGCYFEVIDGTFIQPLPDEEARKLIMEAVGGDEGKLAELCPDLAPAAEETAQD